jgi:hypothetical protein
MVAWGRPVDGGVALSDVVCELRAGTANDCDSTVAELYGGSSGGGSAVSSPARDIAKFLIRRVTDVTVSLSPCSTIPAHGTTLIDAMLALPGMDVCALS